MAKVQIYSSVPSLSLIDQLDPLPALMSLLDQINMCFDMVGPSYSKSKYKTEEFHSWKKAALRFDGLLLDLRDVVGSQVSGNHPLFRIRSDDLAEALKTAQMVVHEIFTYSGFNETASRISFDPAISDGKITVYRESQSVNDTLAMALALMERIRLDVIAHDSGKHAVLRDVIPQQKVAPVQFSVKHGKLVVVAQPARIDEADTDNVQHSRDALLSKGNTLVEELQRSNCDRRLLQSVAELQQTLESCEHIIRLGLMNIGVEAMCNAFVAELPDAIRGMMLGHTRGIAMYVAQFPDWQKFSEKAAAVELTQDDIKGVSETAKRLAADLEQHPEITDEEVPKTIRALQQLIDNPALATKRAAYALMRTIENLVAKTLEYCADLLDKTAQKTIDCVSGVASKTLAAMMAVALVGAVGLTPVSATIKDAAWVKEAAEIVKRQIEAFEAK